MVGGCQDLLLAIIEYEGLVQQERLYMPPFSVQPSNAELTSSLFANTLARRGPVRKSRQQHPQTIPAPLTFVFTLDSGDPSGGDVSLLYDH
jgi:hypothetical protein